MWHGMIKVVIADDQPIIRHGLKFILEIDDDIELVGEAENGIVLLEVLKETDCDVILMDISMPKMDGVEATLKIKKMYPEIKVLILTTFEDNDYIFNGLRNGADGYLLKDADPDEIIRAIKTVNNGSVLLHPKVSAKIVSLIVPKKNNKNSEFEQILTTREKEVARLVAQGKTNKDVSNMLFISEGTVKNHITKILDKLELKNRNELTVYMTKVIGVQ